MKKIVPFSNTLEFKTDVSEITAISLEHQVNKDEDSISGVFNISGYYKILDAAVETTPFNFDLPFDIALGANYDVDSLNIEIDDFRYSLEDKKLKVNIDLLIEGELIPETRETNLLEEIIEEQEEKEEPVEKEDSTQKEELPKEDNCNYVTYRVYRVNPEDTIESITTKYGITKEELLDYNSDLDNIKPGDKLIIQSKNE